LVLGSVGCFAQRSARIRCRVARHDMGTARRGGFEFCGKRFLADEPENAKSPPERRRRICEEGVPRGGPERSQGGGPWIGAG
jgi:hypothetical protein